MTKLLLLLQLSQYLHPSLPPGKQERVSSHCYVSAAGLHSQQREAELLTVTSHSPSSMPRQPFPQTRGTKRASVCCKTVLFIYFCCYCYFPIGRGLFGLTQSHLSSILKGLAGNKKRNGIFVRLLFFLFLGKISLEDQSTSKSKEPSRPALQCSQKVSSCCCASETKINVQTFGTARRQWPGCSVIKGSP